MIRLRVDIGAIGDAPATLEALSAALVGLAAKLKADPGRLQSDMLRDIGGNVIGQYFYDPRPNATRR